MPSKNEDLMRELLVESLSEDHMRILDSLIEPKHDEELAEDLQVKATIVRTLLNDLHANNLVEYNRSKNKKTGWYTYLWKRREDKIQDYIQRYLQRKLDKLNERLNEERELVKFNCNCRKVSYDTALEHDFVCHDCGQPYKEYDNTEEVDRLLAEIAEIKSLMEQT